MTTWQSGDLAVNDLKLHYTRTGGEKPPVVLAHGFSDDGLCWTPLAEKLAADYDLIMVDARGHGRSDGPTQGYGSAEQATDLAGVITALGLDRPAVLGHSMGAATALVLAGTYPDQVGAILLEDPPAWWMPPPPAAETEDTEQQNPFLTWIINLKRKTRQEMIADQRVESPTWSEAELGPWADSKLRLSFNVLNQGDRVPVDWPETIQRIACPALLITADPDLGSIVSAERATALQALLPQVQIAHIPNAGHSIHRDQFDPFLAIVRTFLAKTMV